MRATPYSTPYFTPYFTVVITTYQRPTLLMEAAKSVLAQDFTDYELLIVDDASPDNTEQVAQELVADNVRYLRQPTNQGIGAARNLAIHAARGELLVLLDDDDRLAPDFLHQVYQAWQNFPPTVGFAMPGRILIKCTAAGEEELIAELNLGATATEIKAGHDYLQQQSGGGGGLILRLAQARRVGEFITHRAAAEDTDYMIRMALVSDMAIIPQAKYLVYSRTLPQLSSGVEWIGGAPERLADRHRETLRNYPKTLQRYYVSAARGFYARRDRNGGRRCMAKALKLTPFSWRTWRLWVLFELQKFLPMTLRRRLFTSIRHGYQGT